MGKWREVVGQKFNRLLVVDNSGVRRGVAFVKCLCDCGKMIETRKGAVTSGQAKSCGCLQKERFREAVKNIRLTHGKTRSKEYRIWSSMLQRCCNSNDKSYHNYGGRGITVCERWMNFKNFFIDMGEKPTPKHSIDRIDNNKGYHPDNCRWATTEQQANNKRDSVRIRFDGKDLTISEWSRLIGISPSGLWYRLYEKKWPVHKALTMPTKARTIKTSNKI